jgi:hypothetical protein
MAEHMHSQDAPSVPNTTADPKPAFDPATLGNVDVEFQLMDVESEILDLANTLAAKRNRGSFSDYLLAPEKLSSFSADKRLQLMQNHLQRLKTRMSEFASAPPPASEFASAPPPASEFAS